MPYVSLYRKYRSQTFSDLKGQEHVVRTLQNALTSGRIAHAYLFTGPRGTGKTSSARLLAKCLCCRTGPSAEPCNACDLCEAITEGSCIDVNEFDAASESGVDDIREKIVQAVEYVPAMARYKVFIIDEVHDLSPKAFDALLKTIEEPPQHIVFILATTEYTKVPPTIRSRCQKFEFHRASLQELIARLEFVASAEGIRVEPAALSAIARMADGGYRDALTLLEQAQLTGDGEVTLAMVYDQLGLVGEEAADSLVLAMKAGEVDRIIHLVSELADRGRDPLSILESLLYRLADLTRAAYGVESGLESAREAALHEMATKVGVKAILAMRSDLAEAHKIIRDISIPRLWMESELIRISQNLSKPERVPEAKPEPRPEPKVVVAPAAKAEPPAKAVVAPGPPVARTGDDPWSRTYAELAGVSKLMSIKLKDARLDAVNGTEYVIAFERQMDLEWVQEQPKRLAALTEVFRKHASPEATVRLVAAGKKPAPPPEASAVELPLEGKALHDAASEIMRGQL